MLPHVRKAKAKARKRAKAQKKLEASIARLARIRNVVAARAIVAARDDVTAVLSVARGRHFRFRGRRLVSTETFETPRPVREALGTLSPHYQRTLVEETTHDTCTDMAHYVGCVAHDILADPVHEIDVLKEEFGAPGLCIYNRRPPFSVSKTSDERDAELEALLKAE